MTKIEGMSTCNDCGCLLLTSQLKRHMAWHNKIEEKN